MEELVLGGGCFWCTEGALIGLKGTLEIIPGYAGGHLDNPTYEQVCSQRTGHAEVVKVSFDNEKISRKQILEVFFTSHDPTQLNRQGNDIGTHYRSIVLYSSDEQKHDINLVIKDLSDHFDSPIVTEVKELEKFWIAEKYHHEYFFNNPQNPYCQVVVAPKIAKTRARHASLYE